MSSTYVSQRSHFECSYIYYRDDKCILNSHDYKIEVTVCAPDRVSPVIMSFEDLKYVISRCIPNHKFLLRGDKNLDSALIDVFSKFDSSIYKIFDNDITAETLVNKIAYDIDSHLSEYGVILWEVKLRESTDSYVTWNRASRL